MIVLTVQKTYQRSLKKDIKDKITNKNIVLVICSEETRPPLQATTSASRSLFRRYVMERTDRTS